MPGKKSVPAKKNEADKKPAEKVKTTEGQTKKRKPPGRR
jgi:hypothetical protein